MSGSGIEVNIVKRITSLPSVFMLKHYSGQIIKVATDDQSFADCSKYVSRSGATFDGCLTYDGIFVKETRGIYYTPGVPLTEIHNRRKITRKLDEMRNVIEEIIKDLRHGDEKLLIWFDNYKIRIYDKYKKVNYFRSTFMRITGTWRSMKSRTERFTYYEVQRS